MRSAVMFTVSKTAVPTAGCARQLMANGRRTADDRRWTADEGRFRDLRPSSMVHRPWSIAPKSPHAAVFNLMAIMCHQSPLTARNGRFAPLSEPIIALLKKRRETEAQRSRDFFSLLLCFSAPLRQLFSVNSIRCYMLMALIDCVLYEKIRSNLTNLSGPLQAAGGCE
jgi:hypothetical protein